MKTTKLNLFPNLHMEGGGGGTNRLNLFHIPSKITSIKDCPNCDIVSLVVNISSCLNALTVVTWGIKITVFPMGSIGEGAQHQRELKSANKLN